MREYATSLSAVILPVFTVILLAACGSSPGGSGFGGGSSDTTPPVTSVDTPTGNVSKGDTITFTCTDDSSGCKETWLSSELKDDLARFAPAYEISGATTTFTVEISGGHTTGETYDYQFYSVDNSGNTETTKSRLYTITN